MKVTITIENRVKAPKPKIAMFELIVEGVCGDADSTNMNSQLFKHDAEGEKRLNLALILLEEYNKIPSGYNSDKKRVMQACTDALAKGGGDQLGLTIHDLYNNLSDLVGHDSSCDGQWLAALESYDVFYYNELGEKFNTKCQVSES